MEKRIQKLIELSNTSNSELEQEIIKLLSDPYSFRFIREVEKALFNLSDEKHARLRGAFKFFLFSIAAEDEQYKKANEILSSIDTSNFIFDIYDIPMEFRKVPIILHRVGTTSYILRLLDDQIVIKIIKFRYIGNQTISQDTKNYKENFFRFFLKEHSPQIHSTSEKYIIMDFINGKTLREYMQSDIWNNDGGQNISKIISIISDLCFILRQYAQNDIYHLDLSPDNILITENTIQGEVKVMVHLIDFGYNYLLGDRIGSSGALIQVQLYLAPELFISKQIGFIENKSYIQHLLADVYSIGVILLEMLSGDKLRPQEMYIKLENIRYIYPPIGQILEELLDPNPESRVFDEIRTYKVYDNIKNRLKDELQIYQAIYVKEDEKFTKILLSIFDIMFPSLDTVRKQIRELKFAKSKQMEKKEKLKRLLNYSAITHILNGLIVFLFGYFFFNDIKQGSWTQNLPGRMVAISFSLVATRYYINIFSNIETKNISKRNEFWLRLNSFCFAIPILYALVIDPQAWPFCSAFGTIFIVANNHSNYKLALRAKDLMTDKFPDTPLPVSAIKFLNEFSGWWILMAIYGISLLAIGIFLYLNLIKDEWVYASFVTFFVNWKMHRFNCTVNAPWIRGGLERFYYGFSRVMRYDKKKKKSHRKRDASNN